MVLSNADGQCVHTKVRTHGVLVNSIHRSYIPFLKTFTSFWMLQRLKGTGGCITFFSGCNAVMIYTHTFRRWTSLEEPTREHSISLESIFLVTSWRSASYLPPLTAVPFPCLRFSLNPNSFREESWDSTFMSLWCYAPLTSRRHFHLAAGFPKVSFAGYLTTKAYPFFCTALTTLPPSVCVFKHPVI